MKTIINMADCAPCNKPKLLDVTEWSIDKDFIPSLRARLQREVQTMEEIYLDFSEFENVNHTHEVVMESILQLLMELGILSRITYINLPYAFYDYLRRRFNIDTVLTVRMENK